MDTRDHRKLWAIVMLAGSLGLMATMRSWHQDGQDSYTLVAQDSPLLGESLELEPLSAAVPYWAYASRFLKTNSQVWTPRPEIRTLANDSMAEQKEDEFAYSHFFYGRGGGTFLEIGAMDGILLSTTWALENILGWRGLLMEASPAAFQHLRVHRADQICVHAAVCEAPQTVHFVDDASHPGIVEFRTGSAVEANKLPELRDDNFTSLPTVPCRPLTSILSQFRIQHINFFSLDVAEWDLRVLRATDFSTLSFDVLAIKRPRGSVNPSTSARGAVTSILSSKGYDYYGQARAFDWFVRNGFPASCAPHVSPVGSLV